MYRYVGSTRSQISPNPSLTNHEPLEQFRRLSPNRFPLILQIDLLRLVKLLVEVLQVESEDGSHDDAEA